MKKIACSLMVLLLAGNAHAASLAADTQEVRLTGNVDFDSALGTEVDLGLGYGYFVADYVQLGGLFGFADNNYLTSFELGGFAEYSIETETPFIPFFGSELKLVYADLDVDLDAVLISESESALALALYIGSKFFVTEDLAVSGRLVFETATEDIYIEEDDVNNIDFSFDVGLRYFY
jgi:hypothetical protein